MHFTEIFNLEKLLNLLLSCSPSVSELEEEEEVRSLMDLFMISSMEECRLVESRLKIPHSILITRNNIKDLKYENFPVHVTKNVFKIGHFDQFKNFSSAEVFVLKDN
jgi:hypothetical protein